MNLFSEDLKDCFALDALNVKNATHVVVEVSWGANSMITMEYTNSENKDKKEIEGQIQAKLSNISEAINGIGSADYSTDKHNKQEEYKLHVFGDITSNNDKLPDMKYEEVLALMRQLPQLVQLANYGKGRPLKYKMVPLSVVEQYLKVDQNIDRMIKQLDEQAIIRIVQLFDDISSVKQQIYDLFVCVNEHINCIPSERILMIGSFKNKLDSDEAKLRSKLSKLLIEVRSGKSSAEQIETLIEETISGDLSTNKIQDFINNNSDLIEKITFIDLIIKEGVTYIGSGHGKSLEEAKLDNLTGDIYVLFFEISKQKSDHKQLADNKDHFIRMVRLAKDQNKAANSNLNDPANSENIIKSYIAVDLEMRPQLAESEKVMPGTRICHFKNGKYINQDILLEEMSLNNRCLVKSTNQVELVITKPNKRVVLEIRCPGSLTGYCDNTEHNWFCHKCKELIDHGFDGYFYCKCGRAQNFGYLFKCSNDKHGSDYLGFTNDQLTELLSIIRPIKELNILILGETGVGKSTWINGLVNYMTFQSLEEAESKDLVSLIATSFTLTDENFEQREIKVGSDKNEIFTSGQSATQEPKAYVFDWNKILVRLIDTPGIGDTRGLEKDKENFDAILRYISNLSELHGICILLKPNNARLTVMFQFCIKELLTHLHRSASDNIVFCFTNARSTFYRPGDTLTSLRALLKENKNCEIVLSEHTIYCMDNESFRFLCAVHNGINFDADEKRDFTASWDKSVAETNRLFEHIMHLKQHSTKETITLNDTRKIILNLTKPLADINKNIQTNIAIIEDKNNEIKSSEESQNSLLKKLYIPQVVLAPIEIKEPRTVCTKCVTYHKIPGTNEKMIEYDICCDKCCSLTILQKWILNPDLKNCAAMDSAYNCTKCKCGWDTHMNIYYEYKQETINVLNESVQQLINSQKSDVEKVNVYIESMKDEVRQLNEEQNQITMVSVQFGCFLKNNAINPYNDSFKEYLQLLIKQEKYKVNGGDAKSLEGLESMLNNYIEEVRILDESMASGKNTDVLGPNEVNDLVKSLYSLPINGKQLENIMEVSLTSKARMFANYTETHYSPQKHRQTIRK